VTQQSTWEKPVTQEKEKRTVSTGTTTDRWKFAVGGLLLLGAVLYLMVSGTTTGARYFITVDDIVGNDEYVGQTVRISGAVLGETIEYDAQNLILDFTIAHIPENTTDLARTLYEATIDPNVTRLPVHIENEVKPDLLTNEAQAILTGEMGEDGIFYASELLLKCPSRYDENTPGQALVDQQ
jgi:cytochrome c-type biogenesis protein CcmE